MPLSKMSRRRLLGLIAGAYPAAALAWRKVRAAEPASSPSPRPVNTASLNPKIGLALGGGGANGLAHILMLEALDEMGQRPHRISGSSIGAVIGALYASGKSGRQIREIVERFIISPEERLIEELVNRQALRWLEFLEIELGEGGLLSSEGFISFLYDTLECDTFEALRVPLRVTAADLWERTQVVLESGPLLPAIKASMALPGVFQPVVLDNRLLIDGGAVNPVPYDLLTADCDIVIGIDVAGERTRPDTLNAGYFETVFNSVKVMQQAIMTEKLKRLRPTILIAPTIVDVRALEFYRAEQVLAQAKPAKEELKRRLTEVLSS